MTTFGKRLIKAAQEASAIARGEADPASYRVHVPASIDVKAVRHKLHLTQAEFSARFAVPLSTLKDWEQHRRTPEGPSRVLLTIIDRAPEAVERALAAETHAEPAEVKRTHRAKQFA
jgi:putative transcriptional regulator